jgi:nitric oxide reductase subunit B
VTDTKKLWKVLGGILLVSFGILLFMGRQIYLTMPPIPAEVRTASGETLYTRADIQTGQKVWQMVGGHQMGSVWGHGSYVAPDWTADWLHRESVALLDLWAERETGRKYADLDPPQQASFQARLQAEMRANSYDPATGIGFSWIA